MNTDTAEFTWAEAMALKSEKLAKIKPEKIGLEILTYDQMQSSVERMKIQHSSKRSYRWFVRLQPVIDHLRAFSGAVDVFTQTNPEIACLIWGSIKLILDAAVSFSVTMDTIIGMYESIATSMPRFQEYMGLFPHRNGLQKALLRIYCAYMDFSIGAAKFFKHNVPFHLAMSFLKTGSLKRVFETVIEQIRSAVKDFDAEAHLAHTVSTKSALDHISNVLPRVNISSHVENVFSVPLSRNVKYLGRNDELQQLQSSLVPSTHEQKSCVVHGTAGVGKTQTALEFAYMQHERRLFSHILWIPCEDETVLADAFARLPHILGMPLAQVLQEPARLIDMALSWLCRNDSWLIIFDNAEASDLLNRYWPPCSHGSILVTTQDRRLVHRSQTSVHLAALTEDQGSQLLLNHLRSSAVNNSAPQLGREISREVNGLPLLLVGLAGHITDSQVPLSHVLEDMRQPWDQSHDILQNISSNSAAFHYERPVHMAFGMSLNRLSPAAMAVLRIMSMLSPDHISEELVANDIEGHLSFLGYQDKYRFCRDVRSHLLTRHLVEFQESTDGAPFYFLHRQLQWKVLTDLRSDPHARQRSFDQSVTLVYRDFPHLSDYMIPMVSEWTRYQESMAHVVRLVEIYRDCKTHEVPVHGRLVFAELLASAGNYLYEQRLADTGLAVLQTSAEICRALHATSASAGSTEDNPEQISLSDLTKLEATAEMISWGIISGARGITGWQLALDHITRVLLLRKEHTDMVGSTDERFGSRVLLSNAYNDIACQMIHTHRYTEAEEYLLKSLELKDELSVERPLPVFEYAESKNNLAYVRLGQARTDDAVTFSKEALDLISTTDGQANDHTRFMFGHAVSLLRAGKMETAIKMFENVRDMGVSIFGASNPIVRDSAFALAVAFYKEGRLQEARDALKQCFEAESPSTWPRECLLRAQFFHTVTSHGCGDDHGIDTLRTDTVTALTELIGTHCPVLLPRMSDTGDSITLLQLFDYCVPYTSGRFFG